MDAKRRAFKKVLDGASALNDITNAKSATFYDLDEDVIIFHVYLITFITYLPCKLYNHNNGMDS